MPWPRHACPFGLPDGMPDTDTIILDSLGHALRELTADTLTTDLPAEFIVQLCRLQRRELAERKPPSIESVPGLVVAESGPALLVAALGVDMQPAAAAA